MRRGKAESKVHSLNLDNPEPPVDSVIILPAGHKHELHHSLFNYIAEHETNPIVMDNYTNLCSKTHNGRTNKSRLVDGQHWWSNVEHTQVRWAAWYPNTLHQIRGGSGGSTVGKFNVVAFALTEYGESLPIHKHPKCSTTPPQKEQTRKHTLPQRGYSQFSDSPHPLFWGTFKHLLRLSCAFGRLVG